MISTVAVGIDGTTTAAEAVNMAAELAQALRAKLVLLSASDGTAGPLPTGDQSVELDWAHNTASRTRELVEQAEHDLKTRGLDCSTRIGDGDPADVLVQLAGECGADVLVIGNKGMHRRLLGSVPNTVTHKAGCSVLVVKTT